MTQAPEATSSAHRWGEHSETGAMTISPELN